MTKIAISQEGELSNFGILMADYPDNIKNDITRGITKIRSGYKLSPKRIDKFRNVKAFFTQSKLGLKASEFDRLIYKED